ncbi:MFS transporter [Falsirhodobacter algicola]|uniref:MFS transporter n=1 Tax=Falsirhodobacter algicola TaxID=2692330 RepID=A0A8J8SLF6_9RHOB|nr:MFS transporter [Falsirhodobacter algicola]QUS36359.1 MFS transporter [Falsirhodobacter algicola]
MTIPDFQGKRGALVLLLIAQVLAMSVWFSSAAAIADIKRHYTFGVGGEALLTSAVQIGFVLGTILSALLALADRFDPRRLFALSAGVAAAATAALTVMDPVGPAVIALRILTGVCMAGVYPVGMRLAATWARGDVGLLIGLLVGALTLGSASPHLLAAFGGLGWRSIYAAATIAAICAAVLIGFVRIGPNMKRATRIDLGRLSESWRRPAVRKVNLGYLGHMWELYAMWTWLGLFLNQSFTARGMEGATVKAAALTFATVAAGAVGSWLGGALADRHGRSTVTLGAMAISGTCAALAGWLFLAPLPLLMAVMIVWGITVIADSAQFSASVTELAEPESIGTLLTVQTCAGFLLTLASIQAVPLVQAHLGWTGAFSMLAIGPFLGCIAIWRLRRDPEAGRLAGGRA